MQSHCLILWRVPRADFLAVLTLASFIIPELRALTWDATGLADKAEVSQCVGDDVVFNWKYTLGAGETVQAISWSRSGNSSGQVASLAVGTFVPTNPRYLREGTTAGIKVTKLEESDFGTYEVRVTPANGGSPLTRTAVLKEKDDNCTGGSTIAPNANDTNTSGNDDGDGEDNLPLILGGIAGAIVVLIIISMFAFFMVRRQNQPKERTIRPPVVDPKMPGAPAGPVDPKNPHPPGEHVEENVHSGPGVPEQQPREALSSSADPSTSSADPSSGTADPSSNFAPGTSPESSTGTSPESSLEGSDYDSSEMDSPDVSEAESEVN